MSRPSIGAVRWSRQAGSASTGRRSMSRTRKRNERERAPMTIEARRAMPSGTAAEQRLLDRQARAEMARERRPGGHEAAQVDDAPHAGARRPRRRTTRPPRRSASANAPATAPSMEWMR